MTAIRLTTFAGQNLRTAPHLLQAQIASSASNLNVQSGALTPFNAVGADTPLVQTGPIKSIYRFAGEYWFAWPETVYALPGPIAGDTQSRTYFTGNGAPKMTYAGIATSSGDGKYPSAAYLLGLPAPGSACIATLEGEASDPTDLAESRAYVYTFVSGVGEEGPPSPASGIVNWKGGQSVTISGMIGAPSGNYNVTNKRIYRTGSDGTFRLVGQVALGTTFSDALPDNALGEALPSTDWVMPPGDMTGLIALPNGAFAAYSKNTLCFSVPYLPYAWPQSYRLALDYPIVGLGAFGQSIAVLTQGNPYLITGSDPSAMSAEKIEAYYPCLSSRSVVDLGYAIAYGSDEGLMSVSRNGTTNLTGALMTREQWQAWHPATLLGFRWRGKYVGVSDNHAFLLGPEGTDFTDLSLTVNGGWSDPATGDLWLIDAAGAHIHTFDSGAAGSLSWSSKTWILESAVNFSAARIEGDGTWTFTLTGDGSQRYSGAVSAGKPFALPGGYRATRWSFTLAGTGTLRALSLAESVAELMQAA